MKTHAAAEQLSAYLDAELAEDQRLSLEAHLRECGDCARHLEELLAVDATARAVAVEAPAGYFESFPGRLRARLEDRPRRRVPVWALAAAAGLALAVITPLTLERRDSPAPEPRRQTAAPATVPAPEQQRSAAVALATPPAVPDQRDRASLEHAEPTLQRQRKEAPAPAAPAQTQEAEREKIASAPSNRRHDEARPSERRVLAMPSPVAGSTAPEGQAAPMLEVDSFSQPPAKGKEEATASAPPPPAAPQPGPALAKRSAAAKAADSVGALAGGRAASVAVPGEGAFAELSRRGARTAAESRVLRDDWQAFVRAHPQHPQADEARVRALEWGALAWRLGKEDSDRRAVEREAAAYLARDDARQRDRVRALLETLAH